MFYFFFSCLPFVHSHDNNASAKRTREAQPHHFLFKSHILFPWICDIVCNDSILNTVKSVVGNDVLVANSALHTRQEGDNGASWHQVASNWTDEDKKHPSVLVQIALAKSDPKSPVMKFVPGSHSQTMDSEPIEPLNDSFARSRIVDTTSFEKQGVDMSLESGECVFLHPNIVQSSPEEIDDLTILSVLYVSASSNPISNGMFGTSAMLVSGQEDSVSEYDVVEKRPADEFSPKALDLHRSQLFVPLPSDGDE